MQHCVADPNRSGRRTHRRRSIGLTGLSVVTLMVAACGAEPDSTNPTDPTHPTSERAGADEPDPEVSTEPNADPVESATPATVTIDERLVANDDPSTATSTLISAEAGGSIQTTASDGTVFTFEVPPGALVEDTTITATATDVTGITGVDATHTIRLEPAGLRFSEPASLRIEPPTPIADGFVLPFTAAGDGTEPQLAPLDDGEAIVMPVTHFSLFGLGELATAISEVVVEIRVQNAENEMFNRIARDLEIRRAARNTGLSVKEAETRLLESMTAYLDKVVKPLAASSSGDCTSMQSISSRLLTYHLIATKNGIAGVGNTAAIVQGQILAMEKVCEKEKIAKCKADKNPEVLVQFWIKLWTYKIPAGFDITPSVSKERQRAREICLPKAYDAVGGADDFVGTGKICDLTQPFVISGRGITVNFTPTGELGGTYNYSGSAGGVSVAGEGIYTVTLTEGGGTIDGYGPGRADRATGSGSEVYTLTPIPPC